MAYSAFARYYDSLTRNIDYDAVAGHLCDAMKRLNHKPGLTLDLACGTGSLTVRLAERGIDVYGLDASPEMLSIAQRKASAAGHPLFFICQKMQEMDLAGKVDTVICILDSINHLISPEDVLRTFRQVSRFLNPGGFFLFDVNTLYKHCFVLKDHTYVYDLEDIYCVWQNINARGKGRIGISLDFFERRGSVYIRSSERFYERAYPIKALLAMLKSAGIQPAAVWRGMDFSPPGPRTQRVLIAAEKPE